MSYVLGIDLGTSSLKGILMSQSGELIGTKSASYGIDNPKPGFSEQKPIVWLEALEDVLDQLRMDVVDFGSQLAAISFSGQMHSLVALGEDLQPVYPAILWNDVRTGAQCQKIMAKMGDRLLEITGNIALEGFTLPKILWLQENEPEVWARVKHIMLPKDYLGLYLTGNLHSEFSDAAGTLLLDVERHEWSKEIAETFGVSLEILPEVVESTAFIGTLTENVKQRFAISSEVKIFAGAADNAAAALGVGLIDEEVGLISMGTSGVVSSYEPKVVDYKGKLHFFNHAAPGAYYSMGVTLAAGNSLNWYKETFGQGLGFADLLSDVSTVSAGSEGLLFTPYLVGERTPHFDSKIRGSFLGISIKHERRHFSRALLEGIQFSLRDSKDMMEAVKGRKFSRLISVGGGAQNTDIMQMQADIFNAEMIRLTVEQGPGLGACMIAAYGFGFYENLSDLSQAFVHYQEQSFKPIPENVARYEKIYQIWKTAYAATSSISHQLVDFVINEVRSGQGSSEDLNQSFSKKSHKRILK